MCCTCRRRDALQPDTPALGPVRGPSEGLAQAQALLETLERLLTAPFPAPVPLPSGGLLLMLTRILSMDDVVHSSGATYAIEIWDSLSAQCGRLTHAASLHKVAQSHAYTANPSLSYNTSS